MHHPTDRITHTTAFVTPVVEHWLEREIDQWVGTKPEGVYFKKERLVGRCRDIPVFCPTNY